MFKPRISSNFEFISAAISTRKMPGLLVGGVWAIASSRERNRGWNDRTLFVVSLFGAEVSAKTGSVSPPMVSKRSAISYLKDASIGGEILLTDTRGCLLMLQANSFNHPLAANLFTPENSGVPI